MLLSRTKPVGANSAAARHSPRVPKGVRVYAIGDVHGRLDLLTSMLARIEADCARRGPARTHIIMLGDLIDRGPDSRGVIETLRTFRLKDVTLILLTGNHEEVLLRILNGEGALLSSWISFGGAECLRSYGVDAEHLLTIESSEALDVIRKNIPTSHQEFLHSFSDTLKVGDYLFVHAGIRPSVDLSAQDQKDLRWIRQPFLESQDDHGFVVVHGHTISTEIVERVNRIGIDTGAYNSGKLSAVALEGSEKWFLETVQ